VLEFEAFYNDIPRYEGVVRLYHPNGKQSSEVIYADGVPQGVGRWWHANGQPREFVYYDKYGNVQTTEKWDEQGNLQPFVGYLQIRNKDGKAGPR
jgi:antitoxin component YwqK of YwqJK toxin-antitoxin module